MKFLTREQVFERMSHEGHVLFENDNIDYNLNIIGIRSEIQKLDSFGDQIMLTWKYKGVWYDKSFHITTLPGRYYLIDKLLNPAGCAILVPGQYRNAYGIRLHRGKYPALCQTYGSVKVYRDKDRDDKFDLDPKTIISGDFGINIHRAIDEQIAIKVGAFSAGCQVFANDDEFEQFMNLCNKSKDNFGNKFTYTLINEA